MNCYPILLHWQQGGGPSPQAQAIQSQPVPTPAPPVTSANSEVVQAEHDLAQQELAKKSFKKTFIAGDTGGYTPGMSGAPGVLPPRPPGGPASFRR